MTAPTTTRASQIGLRVALAILALYHVGIGVVSCFAPETTIQFAESFYGIHIHHAAAQFAYMLKALGMYALFTGSLLTLALTDPARYRHVVLAAAGLLVMRATTRLLFFDTLTAAFDVTWGHNVFNVALLVAQAGALLWGVSALEPATEAAPTPALQPVLAREARATLAGASQRLSAATQRLSAAATQRLQSAATQRLQPAFASGLGRISSMGRVE